MVYIFSFLRKALFLVKSRVYYGLHIVEILLITDPPQKSYMF